MTFGAMIGWLTVYEGGSLWFGMLAAIGGAVFGLLHGLLVVSLGLSQHLNQSVMKQCGAQWQAAKAAGTTGGATWPQFLKSCRAQLASTTSAPPQGGFMPAPAPAPAPTPAPTQSGSLFPWQRPAAPPAGSAASTGGGSASPQQARYHCPGSTVVWVNEHSHIYHFPGTRDYGHTKSGAYMCEAEAQTSSNRAAMNERHP
jgi:hypothetical protein